MPDIAMDFNSFLRCLITCAVLNLVQSLNRGVGKEVLSSLIDS